MPGRPPLCLAFVDLDDFKPINDRFGHDRGDDVLIHVASVFRELSRDTDVIARYAGDEFVVILPGVTPEEAETMIERIKLELRRRMLSMNGQEVAVRFSFGIAGADEAADLEGLLKAADTKLYAAKGRKKNS